MAYARPSLRGHDQPAEEVRDQVPPYVLRLSTGGRLERWHAGG